MSCRPLNPLERRLVAILAADVEGYSRLMHGDEEATMATLSAHRALVDELIAPIEVGSRTQPAIACSPNSPACSTRFAARSRSKRRFKGRTKASPKGDPCASGSASMSAK